MAHLAYMGPLEEQEGVYMFTVRYLSKLVKDGWVRQTILPGHSLSTTVISGQEGIMPRCEEWQGAAQAPEGQPIEIAGC